jgi:hypothetical protein
VRTKRAPARKTLPDPASDRKADRSGMEKYARRRPD